MKDKKTIIIIILIAIIITGAGVYAYNQIKESAYTQGFQDAVLIVNEQILSNLQQNGYINFVYNLENETHTIKLIPSQ